MIELTFNAAQELLAIRELAQKQAAIYPEGLFFNYTNELFAKAEEIVKYYEWHSNNKPIVLGSFKGPNESVLYLKVTNGDGEVHYEVLTGFNVEVDINPDGTWRMVGSYPVVTRHTGLNSSRDAFYKAVSKITANLEE